MVSDFIDEHHDLCHPRESQAYIWCRSLLNQRNILHMPFTILSECCPTPAVKFFDFDLTLKCSFNAGVSKCPFCHTAIHFQWHTACYPTNRDAIWRKVQPLGLATECRNSNWELKAFMQMIARWHFVHWHTSEQLGLPSNKTPQTFAASLSRLHSNVFKHFFIYSSWSKLMHVHTVSII